MFPDTYVFAFDTYFVGATARRLLILSEKFKSSFMRGAALELGTSGVSLATKRLPSGARSKILELADSGQPIGCATGLPAWMSRQKISSAEEQKHPSNRGCEVSR